MANVRSLVDYGDVHTDSYPVEYVLPVLTSESRRILEAIVMDLTTQPIRDGWQTIDHASSSLLAVLQLGIISNEPPTKYHPKALLQLWIVLLQVEASN